MTRDFPVGDALIHGAGVECIRVERGVCVCIARIVIAGIDGLVAWDSFCSTFNSQLAAKYTAARLWARLSTHSRGGLMRSMLVVVLLFSMAACADSGAAPTIDTLECAPTSIVVGQSQMVNCNFNYQDPDGDVDLVRLSYVENGGAPSNLDTDFVGGAGMTGGPAHANVALIAAGVGSAVLSITLVDTHGNSSNTLTQELTCVSP